MLMSLLPFLFLACLPALPALADVGEADRLLSDSVQEIRQNKLDSALISINTLLDRYPNFRLAQLVKGDLLLARAQPISTLGNAKGARDQQADLREEAKVRIQAVSDPVSPDLVPEEILQVTSDTRYVIAVDAGRARLYVFENTVSGIHRVTDYYVTVGKFGIGKNKEGDKRTPVGLYTITGFKPDSELEELYGIGAYPLSYPNEWDARNGRKGHGIWLHGVPRDTYARPPKASDGCVVLSNDDLKNLGRYISIGQTPVVIAPGLSWVEPGSLLAEKDELQQAIDAWRKDWESRDTGRLLDHYSPRFQAGAQHYPAFAESKRKVNAAKSWIKIDIQRLSIFRQPDDKDIAIVTFDQDYKSNNLNNASRKRQYWQRENGRWRIVQETIL
jgi:murein L,D-transpeptidase YafK